MTVGWQPIETAPKDGTRVLLFVGDEYEIGWWTTFPRGGGGWWNELCDEYGCEMGGPTHWMPLPSPPEVEQ